MEAKREEKEIFQPQAIDEELEEILILFRSIKDLNVSVPAIKAVLNQQRERFPNVDPTVAAVTVITWASSPTLHSRNASQLLAKAIEKQTPSDRGEGLSTTQNAPQRQNPYELRTCERCDLDFGVRKNGALARKQPFLCCDCQILEARWAA